MRPGWTRGLWQVLAAAALAAGCAHGRLNVGESKDGEVVEAEGWSPIDPKDPIGTRQRALAEAQKKAVEEVVGVYISAKTRVDQAVTVDQNILANVGGYIRKYDVLSEREEEGFHKTRIRALVLYQKVGEDLKGAGLMRPEPPPGNPKVAVAVRSGGDLPESWADSASSAVRQALLERGFAVIDLNDKIEQPGVKSTDTATAAAVGRRLQADLVVSGQAMGHPIEDARLGDFHSYRARLVLRVVKPATGEVVSEKSQEASAIDPAADIAGSKAMENAGQLAGEALAAELLANLKGRQNVVVRLAHLGGLDQVQRLAEDLRGTPGVVSVAFSGVTEGMADLLVTTEDMPGDQVGAALLRMGRYRLQMRSVTPYEVELEGS